MRNLRGKQSLLIIILIMVIVFSIAALAVYEPFKVKLKLFDRFICMSLLPPEGNYSTLKIVRDLQMELAPTEEEAKLAGLKPDLVNGGTVADDWDIVPEKEIVFGDIAKSIIVKALEKLDQEEKLTQQHFILYEKFILGDKKEGD